MQKDVIVAAFGRLYIAAGAYLSSQMLLLAASILVASASIYEGHNASGLSALIFALVVSELSTAQVKVPHELTSALEVVGSVVLLSTVPARLSVLSWALTLGCL